MLDIINYHICRDKIMCTMNAIGRFPAAARSNHSDVKQMWHSAWPAFVACSVGSGAAATWIQRNGAGYSLNMKAWYENIQYALRVINPPVLTTDLLHRFWATYSWNSVNGVKDPSRCPPRLTAFQADYCSIIQLFTHHQTYEKWLSSGWMAQHTKRPSKRLVGNDDAKRLVATLHVLEIDFIGWLALCPSAVYESA